MHGISDNWLRDLGPDTSMIFIHEAILPDAVFGNHGGDGASGSLGFATLALF